MWAELSDVSNAASATLNRTPETTTISRSDIAKIIKDAETAIWNEQKNALFPQRHLLLKCRERSAPYQAGEGYARTMAQDDREEWYETYILQAYFVAAHHTSIQGVFTTCRAS
jgi:hypothetical protein